jgi:ankyrin repeat protein
MSDEEIRDLLNSDYGIGQTPLMLASGNLKLDLVKKLLRAGADVTLVDNNGDTALTSAVDGSSPEGEQSDVKLELVRILIKAGSNVNQLPKRGMSPLMNATDIGDEAIVKELLKKGANINQQNIAGWTALILAMEEGIISLIKMLLEKGANVNIQDNNGNTALIETVKKIRYKSESMKEANEHKLKVMDLLLRYHANPDLRGKDGNTALMIAAIKNQQEIMQKLLDNGADPYIKNGKDDFYDLLKYKTAKDWVFKYVNGFEAYKIGEKFGI